MMPWSHNPSRLFLSTFALTSFGEWFAITGMSALVYGLGGFEAVGLYHTLRYLPAFVVSPIAGAIADRVGLSRVVVYGESVQTLSYLGLLCVCHRPDLLLMACYIAGVTTEIARSASRPALLGLVPRVAPPEGLAALNTARAFTYNVAFTAGPIIAGLLLATGSNYPLLSALAMTYIGSTVIARYLPSCQRDGQDQREVRSELKAVVNGGRRLIFDSTLRPLTLLYLGGLIIIGGSQVFVAELCGQVLKLDESWVAGMFGFVGGGAIVGALIGGLLAKTDVSRLRLVAGCIAVFGVSAILCGAVTTFSAAVVAMVVMGISGTSCEPTVWTLYHQRAPEEQAGSIFGVLGVVMNGGFLVGTLLTTALIGWGGYQLGVTMLGLGVVLLTSFVVLTHRGSSTSPSRPDHRHAGTKARSVD